jgi:hypothetical protein
MPRHNAEHSVITVPIVGSVQSRPKINLYVIQVPAIFRLHGFLYKCGVHNIFDPLEFLVICLEQQAKVSDTD